MDSALPAGDQPGKGIAAIPRTRRAGRQRDPRNLGRRWPALSGLRRGVLGALRRSLPHAGFSNLGRPGRGGTGHRCLDRPARESGRDLLHPAAGANRSGIPRGHAGRRAWPGRLLLRGPRATRPAGLAAHYQETHQGSDDRHRRQCRRRRRGRGHDGGRSAHHAGPRLSLPHAGAKGHRQPPEHRGQPALRRRHATGDRRSGWSCRAYGLAAPASGSPRQRCPRRRARAGGRGHRPGPERTADAPDHHLQRHPHANVAGSRDGRRGHRRHRRYRFARAPVPVVPG